MFHKVKISAWRFEIGDQVRTLLCIWQTRIDHFRLRNDALWLFQKLEQFFLGPDKARARIGRRLCISWNCSSRAPDNIMQGRADFVHASVGNMAGTALRE
jgi:hypothetical protein